MEYKYFGIIIEENFIKLNDVEKTNYLSQNQLTHPSFGINPNGFAGFNQRGEITFKIGLNVDNQTNKFNKDIGVEIHHFLLHSYKGYIGADVKIFQMNFIKDNYGIEEADLKKKGLQQFNHFFYECCDKLNQRMITNAANEPQIEPRFATLKRTRDDFSRLINENNKLVYPFLFGDMDYFNIDLYKNNDLIKRIIQFENNIQILQYLNNRFQFEEDEYFSEKSINKQIYKDYESQFKSDKVIDFVVEIFSNPYYKKRKYGLAMRDLLKEELDLMELSAEKFKELCNTYLDCGFKNLERGQISNSHKNHVNNLKKKWEEFNI